MIIVYAVATFELFTAKDIQDPKVSRKGHGHNFGDIERILITIFRGSKQSMHNTLIKRCIERCIERKMVREVA